MTTATERRQVLAYDRIIKTRAWASLLLIHPKGDLEVNGLLAFCPRLQITLVWDPEFVPFRAAPTERARRAAVLARLKVTAGANPRLRILVGEPILMAAQLAQEQHEEALELRPSLFSGAVLAQLDDDRPLSPQLKAWAALVAPGGLLIGKQASDLRTRSELIRAIPKFRPWPSGLWLAEVDGLHINGSVSVSSEVPRDLARTVDENSAPPVAEVEVSVPVPSDASAPPLAALNLRRTRPVWDTLEANLGL